MASFRPAHRVHRLLPLPLVDRLEGWAVLVLFLGAVDQAQSGFLAPLAFDAGITPASVAVGDFNGDGRLDLAVADFQGDTVSVLLGNGDGTFQPAQYYAAGARPQSVVVGDFNGEGIPDLAVANFGDVSVLLGNGDGSFQDARHYRAEVASRSVAVGDFNGDGHLDLAVTNLDPLLDDSFGTVSVLLNAADWGGGP
ncbi:MAG TPA: VCBS repeat-containing protein [Gemmataceae bacterium]|nr:VCBS repeat-containing protein [Gemmataceae bacterium]